MQCDDEGREHPVNFAGKVLNNCEVSYSAFGKEALAVVFALKRFRNHLLVEPFVLYGGHQAPGQPSKEGTCMGDLRVGWICCRSIELKFGTFQEKETLQQTACRKA